MCWRIKTLFWCFHILKLTEITYAVHSMCYLYIFTPSSHKNKHYDSTATQLLRLKILISYVSWMAPWAWQGPTSGANNELISDHLWAQDSLHFVWGSGCEVRHLPGKKGGDGREGRVKWDWCCRSEEAHCARLLGLGDNLLLVCENKMWSHTWLLFLLSICHGPEWKWLVVQCASVHACVSMACVFLHAGNALFHAKIKFTHAERLARKLRGQTHAGTSCLQVDFTGDKKDLWLIRLYF